MGDRNKTKMMVCFGIIMIVGLALVNFSPNMDRNLLSFMDDETSENKVRNDSEISESEFNESGNETSIGSEDGVVQTESGVVQRNY